MQVIWAIGASMMVLVGAQWLGRRACLCHRRRDRRRAQPARPVLADASAARSAVAAVGGAAFADGRQRSGRSCSSFIYPVSGVDRRDAGRLRHLAGLRTARRPRAMRRLCCAPALRSRRLRRAAGHRRLWRSERLAGAAGGVTRTVLDFLNTTKYPPSLDFLLMTLGPGSHSLLLSPIASPALKDALVMFGRVPFAFYVRTSSDSRPERRPRSRSRASASASCRRCSSSTRRAMAWGCRVSTLVWAAASSRCCIRSAVGWRREGAPPRLVAELRVALGRRW